MCAISILVQNHANEARKNKHPTIDYSCLGLVLNLEFSRNPLLRCIIAQRQA